MDFGGGLEFYDKLILFLRRINEKCSYLSWFDHWRCINDDDKPAIVRWHNAKLAAITLVRSRGHSIGATRSHDLQEVTMADHGALADHPKMLAKGTDWGQLQRLGAAQQALWYYSFQYDWFEGKSRFSPLYYFYNPPRQEVRCFQEIIDFSLKSIVLETVVHPLVRMEP